MTDRFSHVRLVMLAKNEAHCIRRSLASARPLIDSWCVVDTGSSDGTPAIVEDAMRGIPGELHHRPWVNFGHNRTESLALARADGVADFLLVLDADDEFVTAPDFAWPNPMDKDCYHIQVNGGSVTYPLNVCTRASLPWRYEGAYHAHPVLDGAKPTSAILSGIEWRVHREGASWSDPEKYQRQAKHFVDVLAANPTDTRAAFYLAQAYRDCGDKRRAVEAYRHRASMGGWKSEVFWSLYQVATLRESLNDPWAEVAQDYLAAYLSDTTRCEPLYRLGKHYNATKEHAAALLYLRAVGQMPPSASGGLFVDPSVHQWLAPIEAAVALYHTGDVDTAAAINVHLLSDESLPDKLRVVAARNLEFCTAKLNEVP